MTFPVRRRPLKLSTLGILSAIEIRHFDTLNDNKDQYVAWILDWDRLGPGCANMTLQKPLPFDKPAGPGIYGNFDPWNQWLGYQLMFNRANPHVAYTELQIKELTDIAMEGAVYPQGLKNIAKPYKQDGYIAYPRPKRKPLTLKLRHSVLARDGYRCCHCGASPSNSGSITLHVDHIIPVSKNGSNDLTNLQTLCSLCNLGKGANIIPFSTYRR